MRSASHHALGSYLRGRPCSLPNGPSAQGPRVALAPDTETTADLPPSALHVPLADLPGADPDALDAARRALASLKLPAISAETSGRGAELVGEALGHLRAAVVGALAAAGARPSGGAWRAQFAPGGPGDMPRAPVVFRALWLYDGRGGRESFPLLAPARAARVAAARAARLRREGLADAAGGRPGWKATRAANGWRAQAEASAAHVARLERGYGMVPAEGGQALPSASSLAPGLAASRPLPCDPSWGAEGCRDLARAARAVHAVAPLIGRFPAARAALRDATARVARGRAAPAPAYGEAEFERDAAAADDVAARLALSAVMHLSDACDAAVVRGRAAAAVRDARDAADFVRARSRRPPVDFGAALRTDRLGGNPALAPRPDPTPAQAVEELAAAAAESREGYLMVRGGGGRHPADVSDWAVRLWLEWDADPRGARERAERRYARAVAALLRQARQVARTGIAPAGWNGELDEAREALARLDRLRVAEVAAAAGLASPAAAAYERLVAAGRAQRAELARRAAELGPRAREALDLLAGRLEAAGGEAPGVRPAHAAAARARLAEYAAALRAGFQFYAVVMLYQGRWRAAGPRGDGGAVGPAERAPEAEREAFRAAFSGPVVGATREAMRLLRDVAAPLERARAKAKMLEEPALLADPWRAVYGQPATLESSYRHVFEGGGSW